ncbi:MAG: hypothetical protein HY757_01965 [Nitrospirae bacterium]|nr:hypothetical protein [Nitrospirota bacterium]
MKMTVNRIAVIPICFVACIILLSSSVFASSPIYPYLDYNGQFWYCNGSTSGDQAWCNSGQGNKDGLDFNDFSLNFDLNVSQVVYMDGTASTSDPIVNAKINIGTLYNSSANPLTFGASSGSTDTVDLSIVIGGITYLTAKVANFNVANLGFGYKLNQYWDTNTLWGVTYYHYDIADPNYSRYIAEQKSLLDNYNWFTDIRMDFDFTSGSNFSSDSYGSIGAPGSKIAALPEPLSALLFIIGGATFSFRRYFKRIMNK